MDRIFLNNTVEQWLYAMIFVVSTFILAKILDWIFKAIKKQKVKKGTYGLWYYLVDLIEKPLIFAIFIIGFWFMFQHLSLGAKFEMGLNAVYYVLITLNVAWFLANLFNTFVEKYAKPRIDASGSQLGKQLMPLFKSIVNIVVWVLAIIFALEQAGYNVGALLAGVGIGGLAIAMAAKDSAANIFGGVAIFSDKSFKVGDFIKVKGYEGIVEEIGVRVTRIRTFAGTMIIIPNSVFTNTELENVSEEPTRRVLTNLGLTYDTPPEKITLAMDILKDVIKNNPHTEDKVLVSFNGFKDSSLNILFIYYIKTKEGADILDTQTEVNNEVLKRFNAESLEFAYPTVTQYNIDQKNQD
ncbi:MAG: mechanosensitive ion channel family protein [Bacteroidales bacterium]|nr:mechanosensitive ion channel family protein [Bacteroidales bacterium]MCF8350942.1 mechanosensitive ion channel family protein [Bacteroidales bacterium]MCF8376559.1 mechanosensitive ion channel family protein [Bacteroidales bacterium]MCF8400589.1 mechanosensitive ion channel family protein [Bacteroidales bacterium]